MYTTFLRKAACCTAVQEGIPLIEDRDVALKYSITASQQKTIVDDALISSH